MNQIEQPVTCNLCGSAPDRHQELITTPVKKPHWPGSPTCRVACCEVCGFTFLSPRLDQAGYNQYYAADYYEEMSGGQLAAIVAKNEGVMRRVLDEVAPHVVFRPDMKVIDVGCGYGEMLSELRKRHGGQVVGVELSAEAARFARENYGLTVLEEDVNERISAGDRYDLVFLIATLEHVLDGAALLRTLRAMLAPGGRLVVLVPDLDAIQPIVRTDNASRVFKVVHTYYFTRKTLPALAGRSGLATLSVKSGPFSSAGQHDLVAVFEAGPEVAPVLPVENWGEKKAGVLSMLEKHAATKPTKPPFLGVSRIARRVLDKLFRAW
ncbi:class I SAM-dependent methyltransferase [Alsobacter metallidurans]|uniref:class I SAM-dependent methyltransferase n=1 Tax=Alsobacter metallidurans TaxID=340221 RepID=UPI00166AA93B|nr:class I SAM-dependent methyltransferase [Alsobacter metallidurans]